MTAGLFDLSSGNSPSVHGAEAKCGRGKVQRFFFTCLTWRLAEFCVTARQRKSKGGAEISSECKDGRGEALGEVQRAQL